MQPLSLDSQTKWAVLVGIDEYAPGSSLTNHNGAKIEFKNLGGCVNDVDAMNDYLRESGVQHIIRLCSPKRLTGDQEPTAKNIIDALQECKRNAKREDLVLFHFSGHGARVTTKYPDIRGQDAFDEFLAPCNVNRDGVILRDITLESLLRCISQDLLLTVTLDSCHSGGAFRQGNQEDRIRGVSHVVNNSSVCDQPVDSLGLSHDVNQQYSKRGHRRERNGWLLDPEKYALLAACSEEGNAHEVSIGGQFRGLFTHWLLDTLRSDHRQSTHRIICDRVAAKVRAMRPQEPASAGSVDRHFLGALHSTFTNSFILSKVPQSITVDGALGELYAGKMQDVCRLDEYEIYRWDITDRAASERLGTIRIEAVMAWRAEVKFIDILTTRVGEIEPGCRAVRVKRRKFIQVKLKDIEDSSLISRIESVIDSHKDGATPFQCISSTDRIQGNINPQYQIESIDAGKFRLLSGEGVEIPFLPSANSPEEVVKQALHLGTFSRFRHLKSQSVHVNDELLEFFEGAGNTEPVSVVHGGKVTCTINNRTDDTVFVTVLNFRPLWGVKQTFPVSGNCAVSAHTRQAFTIVMTAPTYCGNEEVTDIFKCVITSSTTHSDILIMEGMGDDESFPNLRSSRQLANFFQRLISQRRHAKFVGDEYSLWTTKEIAVKTHRPCGIA